MTSRLPVRRHVGTRRAQRVGLALGLVAWRGWRRWRWRCSRCATASERVAGNWSAGSRSGPTAPARFIGVYAAEVIARERTQAAAQLGGPRVGRRDFDAVVAGGGYQAAVLVD